MKSLKPGPLREVSAVAIFLLTAIGFLEGIHSKRGIDDWVWYFVAMSLAVFINSRVLPFILASIFSALTLTGFYLSPAGKEPDVALINCLIGIGVLWITALVIFFQNDVEREWRRSEFQFRSLFKNMQIGFAHCRMIYKGDKPVDFVYLSVNPAFAQITGLNGVVGKRVSQVIPGITAAHPELFEAYGKVAAGGKPRKFEYHLETSNVWLSVSAYSPAKGYFVTTFENITERKHAEASLTLFRALIDRSSDGINVVDPNTGLFCDVNETTCRQLGYTRAEVLNMRVTDVETVIKPEMWPTLVQDLRQRRSHIVEGGLRRKDGTTFPVEVNLRWVELEREYIVAVVRDITERKQAEEAVKKSQEQLLSVVKQAPVSIAMFDREMRYMITSDRWNSEYAQKESDLIGRSHYEVCPDLPEAWKKAHQRALAGEFVKNDEDLWVKADGSRVWLRWVAHPWWDKQGSIGGVIISTENITERKAAEDAVRQSEDHLRMVTENARVGLVMVNRERVYTFANRTYYEILNVEDEIVGRHVSDVVGTAYKEQVKPQLDRAFTGERASYEIARMVRNEERFYAVRYEPMARDGIVLQVVAVVTDITEQKRSSAEIQNQLDELQRWHGVMIGREERILGLKREVNELLASQHKGRRYSDISIV